MIFKTFASRQLIRMALLLIVLCLAAWVIVTGRFIFLILILPTIAFLCYRLYTFQQSAFEEINQFIDAVHYRDFSRNFNESTKVPELRLLHKGFNRINNTLKLISKEKETQYQYLQKILEMIGTGILSYNHNSGEIVWMNESLKKMLQLPYLKTIHSLEKRDPFLYTDIVELRSGAEKIAALHQKNTSLKILLSATTFQTSGESFRLIAFQNISEALDETESKAWQKLLSVLTHEIMNSVAPISSLAETLKTRLEESPFYDDNATDDLRLGIETIRKRSEGLLKFAQTYRNLNKITTLTLQKVLVRDVFENLLSLMQPTLEQKNIEVDTILKDPELHFQTDVNLIEQVLINLLVNAIEAVRDREHPLIILTGSLNGEHRPVIRIADNGTGMTPEVAENIFIPFFSTKKNGTGIGLSLCKQIMQLHKGTIQVQTSPGAGTEFLLTF